jgi:Sulfotransferase family
MKKNYFFIHVPKTAGTSFRYALKENKLIKMLYDYGKGNPHSSPELVDIEPKNLTLENEIFDIEKFNFICGHINYSKYSHCVSPDSVVSIIRNPIERIVSEYQHLKRLGGLTSSFTSFCERPIEQNKQERMLKGLNFKDGSLVGLTSHYKYFVEIFSNKFGIPLASILANKAPSSDTEDRFNIAPDEIKEAYHANKKDIEFFFNIVNQFIEFVQGIGYNTILPKDTKWSCRIDSNRRVVGWIPCTIKDCYFIVIKVNGKRRVVISLDQTRMDVYRNKLSENPICGFSYPLSLLGVEQGDEINVGLIGTTSFDKKLSLNSNS